MADKPSADVRLADGRVVPGTAIDALASLDRRWPGATLPMARGAVAAAVLEATLGYLPGQPVLGNLVSIDEMIKEASRQAHAIGDAGKAGQAVNRASRLGLNYAQDWPIVVAVQVAVEMLLTGHAADWEDRTDPSWKPSDG